MILFLDYDGVLHPDAVYLVQGRPVLRAEGKLFMWTPQLIEVLADFPSVRIVLSTSWVRELGFQRAMARLPEPLRSRVIGATWHSGMTRQSEGFPRTVAPWWDAATRYRQVRRYVDRAALADWVAIDDHPEGWAPRDLHRLVKTESATGLSDPAVLARLAACIESASAQPDHADRC